MKVAAIITEYNPFHYGHAYQLSQIDADFVMVIMSGNFVQRGEPAFVDKWTRTEMALANGVDLVLELPTSIATGSAEYFARGAVFLLDQSHVVDQLCFGGEHPDINPLQAIADVLAEETTEFSASLQAALKQGYSFAGARQKTLEELFPDAGYDTILKGSNNILAIEYLKALRYWQSSITPYLIPRKGQDYSDSDFRQDVFLSATAIRRLLTEESSDNDQKLALPDASYQLLRQTIAQSKAPVCAEDIYPFLRMILLRAGEKEIANLREIGSDLSHRLLANLKPDLDYAGYVDRCSSRNYPTAKIKRALLYILLRQPCPQLLTPENSYLKILGFRRSAAPLLKRIRKYATIPVITNTRNTKQLSQQAQSAYQAELRYDRMYAEIVRHKFGTHLPPTEQRNPILIP